MKLMMIERERERGLRFFTKQGNYFRKFFYTLKKIYTTHVKKKKLKILFKQNIFYLDKVFLLRSQGSITSLHVVSL